MGEKTIHVPIESVHLVLGIPIQGRDISVYGQSGRDEFLELINESSILSIRFCG